MPDRSSPAATAMALALWMPLGLASAAEPGASPAGRKVDFNREVRPILAKNCFACHGQDEAKRAKGLRLDVRRVGHQAAQEWRRGDRPRRPGFRRADRPPLEEDETLRMPPKKTGNRLTPVEVETLRRWVDRGPRTPGTGP